MYILSRTSILNAIKRALETYNKLHLKIDIKLLYHPNVKKILTKAHNFDDLEKGLCFVSDMALQISPLRV